MPKISVIIPTLNESAILPECLGRLAEQGGTSFEIIVSDGDSRDGTGEIASTLGARVVRGDSHRAKQLNRGAEAGTGDYLLFLHADTILPRGALLKIGNAFENRTVVGGAFARRFNSPSLVLKITCRLAQLRNVVFGWHLGDQAIFCRRSSFEILGGFREMKPFEDLDLSRRLGRLGRLVTLHPPVLTSARRFEAQGPWRTSMRDFWLTMQYLRKPQQFVSA